MSITDLRKAIVGKVTGSVDTFPKYVRLEIFDTHVCLPLAIALGVLQSDLLADGLIRAVIVNEAADGIRRDVDEKVLMEFLAKEQETELEGDGE